MTTSMIRRKDAALWLAIAFFSTALTSACSNSGGDGSSDPGPDTGGALLAAPKPGEGIQLTISGFEVPKGGETEVCQRIYLDNEEPIEIGGYEVRMPSGSHHFVVYAYQGEGADQYPEGLFKAGGCIGVGPPDSMNLVQVAGAGSAYEKIDYPATTGIVLRPHQPILLNSHYANATLEPTRPTVYANLYFAKERVTHPIEGAAISNYNILIPPGRTRSTTARWTIPFDMYMIMFSSHEHKRGKLFTARIAEGAVDRPEGDLIGDRYQNDTKPVGSVPESGDFYRSENWEHPTVLTYQEPRLFRQGTVVEFTCTHHNDKRVPLAFGPLSDDEMCFSIGMYYRADTAPPPGTRIPTCLAQDAQLTCSATPVSAIETGPVICGDGKKARAEQCDRGSENGGGSTCSGSCELALDPGTDLGIRDFPIVFAGPGAGASDFLNSITGGSSIDGALGILSDGALRFTAGAPNAEGHALVSQAATVTLGAGILAGNGSFCARFYPTPDAGILQCRGGTGVGVSATIDNATRAAQPTDSQIAVGGGGDAGPGSALFNLNVSMLQIAGSPQECLTRDWSADPIYPLPFTTGNVIGTITSANGQPGTAVVMSRDGENFDCSQWRSTNGPGILQSMPLLSPNTVGTGDVIAQLAIAGHQPYGGSEPEPEPSPTPVPTEIGGELAGIVDDIFTPHCSLPSCHSSLTQAGAMVLERSGVYDEIVDVPSFNAGARSAGLLRVVPGDPDASFLMRKLTGELGAGQGAAMPLGNPRLDEADIERIRAWIAAGAAPR